ncbi:MAG: hypothetical protein WCS37_06820 [Chloroflexota bacterium]|nr:hypothetical protein [Chloroflexota bacterium]
MAVKVKPRTVRDTPNRPTKSAIPRTEGSIFLVLNRLSSERERLQQDEANLLKTLDLKRQRMELIEAEMNYYKAQLELFHPTNAPKPSLPAPSSRTQVPPPANSRPPTTGPVAPNVQPNVQPKPTAARPVAHPKQLIHSQFDDVEEEETLQWQPLTIEY